MSSTSPPPRSSDADPAPSTSSPVSARAKLRKIPPIINRRNAAPANDDDEDEDELAEEILEKLEQEKEEGREHERERELELDPSPSILLAASSLGLNHIRTRSTSSPLRYSSSVGATASSFLANDAPAVTINVAKPRSKASLPKEIGPSAYLIHFSLCTFKTLIYC